MARESHLWINGLWDRIDDEIYKQHKTKAQVAKSCRFDRRTLYGEYNMSLPYFARLCAELGVSADYLGKNDYIVLRYKKRTFNISMFALTLIFVF